MTTCRNVGRPCSEVLLLQDTSEKKTKQKKKKKTLQLVFDYTPLIIKLSFVSYPDPIVEHVPLSDDALHVTIPFEATACWFPHLDNGLECLLQ